MESGAILNSHITASSSWRSSYNGAKARLNRNSVWVVRSNNANHWLQVDLRKVKTVTKVATQGRPHSYSQWVTSYTVSYSTDGRHWIAYTDFGRVKVKVFETKILVINSTLMTDTNTTNNPLPAIAFNGHIRQNDALK